MRKKILAASFTDQTGRTILEMLSILVIVGVLSITALVGFTYAMNRHKANETVHDVMLRASNVPMIDEFYAKRTGDYEWTFAGLPENGKQGTFYTMQTLVSDLPDYLFRVVVSDVPKRVCSQIIRLNPSHVDAIYVEADEITDEICPNETNSMAFYFKGFSDETQSDLPEIPSCENIDCGLGSTCVEGICVPCTDGSVCNCPSGTWNTTAHLCCEEAIEPSESVCYTYALADAADGQCPGYTFTYLSGLCGTNGYCNNGVCTECSEDELASEDGCEMIPCELTDDNIASAATEYCCTSFGGVWENETCACPEGYIFDAETDQCIESDGQCIYNYNNPNSIQVSYADCTYTNVITDASQESYADCIYSNADPASGEILSMSSQMSCPSGQYCYLKWTTDSCSSETGASGATTLYGRCLPLDSTNAYCKKRSDDNLNMTATKQCPTGQYCYLKWTTDSCSSETEASGAPTLYGRCLPLDSTSASCKITYSENLELSAIQSCPSNQYCYLKWSDENCSSTVGSTGANPFHGVCLDLDSVNAVCP